MLSSSTRNLKPIRTIDEINFVLMSSIIQDRRIQYIAARGGSPTYWTMSARSTYAESSEMHAASSTFLRGTWRGTCPPIALARFEVDIISTFLRCFNLSSWVKSAFTTFAMEHTMISGGFFSMMKQLNSQGVRGFSASHGPRASGRQTLHFVYGYDESVLSKYFVRSAKSTGKEYPPINTTTNVLSSSTISVTEENRR